MADNDRRLVLNRHSLVALRMKAALSVTELAAKAAMSHGTLIDLETGRRNGSAATIRRLAEALGVHPDAIITNPSDREPAEVGG